MSHPLYPGGPPADELNEPTPEEIAEMFAPAVVAPAGTPGAEEINSYWEARQAMERSQASSTNFAQGGPATYDTVSNHVFDSWTDKDLYRAIDAPEYPEGPARDAEILEYVEELKKRKAEAERLAARSAELREKYQI